MGFQMLAALTGILVFYRKKDFREKMLIVYLVFIAIAEWVGWSLRHAGYKIETSLLYSWLVIPAEFLFAYWFIGRYSHKGSLNKTMAFWFSIIGLGVNILEQIFLRDQKFFFSSLAFVLFVLFLVIMVMIYLFEFTRSPMIAQPLSYISFWVCIAYLIYFLLTFPLFSFYNILYQNSKPLFYVFWKAQMGLNMAMYFLITCGLVWTSRKLK